jgi:ribonuclease P/MRP protein subunit RPP40
MQEALTAFGLVQFNLNKYKVMHVGRNNPEYNHEMNGTKLGVTDEEKDVGVWVTRNLKPSVHCQKSATRATAMLNQITRNFHYRNRHTYKKLYKQYVRPHLEYASPAWSPEQQGDKDVLERVHEKAVKLVSGLKSNSYRETQT